uniref:Integral membrane protein n=1 Tax=Streptomyces sp. NBC_00049 TaxID=2903617 RepID=A0AAU2JWP8_9ACTN
MTTVDPHASAAPARRRVGGDPVKTLLHRHRELCERAVDPLEIAAGLEAHGITDRTAARFRHRDVFSLAEELYARTPRGEVPTAAPARVPAGAAALRGFGYSVLPGAFALATAAAGPAWAGPVAVVLTVAALVWPGRAAGGRFPYTAHLLASAVVGWAAYRHGTALAVCLALAVAPGHLVAAAYAGRARVRLAGSRALEDFTDRARPLLIATVLVFTAAAAGAAAVAGASLRAAVPLALVLFLTRLLLRHGAHRGPVAAALALALVPLPEAVLAAAAGLLVQAVLALCRASAHARP